MRNGRITDPAPGGPANGALTRPPGLVNRHQGRDVNPLGGPAISSSMERSGVMYHKRWALAGAAATALSVLAGLVMAAPAAAAAGWTSVSVPQTGNNAELNGMSARTSTDAWAVGVQFGAAGQTPPPPVAYHWHGSAWSLTATPSLGVNAGLNAVSASSASDAWAVGFTLPSGYRVRQSLYEHWNGSAWSIVPSPTPGAYPTLNAVAAR